MRLTDLGNEGCILVAEGLKACQAGSGSGEAKGEGAEESEEFGVGAGCFGKWMWVVCWRFLRVISKMMRYTFKTTVEPLDNHLKPPNIHCKNM